MLRLAPLGETLPKKHQRNYTLYYLGTDNTQFVQAGYQSEKMIKGFG